MITVGFSTRGSKPEFIEYLKTSSGLKDINVIEKVNNGSKSLSEVYNEIINESTTDIVVLCHDDIYFDSKRWAEKITKHFEKSSYGILGVAGSTYMPKSGQWWEDQSKMIGIVNHEANNKKWESKYSEDIGNEIKDVVIVDGLFIALKKDRIKANFDETVKGFHMYDINFCFQNFLKEVKIGVVFNVRVTHKSIGQVNEQWELNREIFSKRYSDNLPVKVLVNNDTKLKLLFACKNITNYKELFSLPFFKNKDITLISDSLTKDNRKELNSLGVKTHRMNDIPGYRIGDGRSFIKTPEGVVKSVLGAYYMISNINYDFVVSDTKEYFDIVKFMHSQTPKIFLTKEGETVPQHDSIGELLNQSDIQSLPEKILSVLNTIPEFKQKIKILTGYSERGGSTTALINLTNFFNENNIDCTLYGPHKWHLDKCKSDLLQNLKLDRSDKLITHYLQLKDRPNVERVVLSSHELGWFPVGKIPQHWDEVIFLHDKHREFHSDYSGEYSIIPNLREDLISGTKKEGVEKVCGIIGTIETRKQTHKSIERALNDGCEKVILFGKIGEDTYYQNFVEPFMSDPRVEHAGFTESKQEMYDSIGRVYHTSMGEVACLVKDECYNTGTEFYGNEQTEHEVSKLTNKEILELWKKSLQL